MKEIWKDIDGFEGDYQISNLGNVLSLKYGKHRLLSINKSGCYAQVILSKNGKFTAKSVHKLVALAFIPNPNCYPIINHKDTNPFNNEVSNLEWCTYKYNNEYNGRIEKCRDKIRQTLLSKTEHHKMTPQQIENIRKGAYKGWETRRKKSNNL